MDSESISGRILGNVPVVLIFVLIIVLIMNFANVQIFAGAPFPAFLFAFFGTFIPMYVLCFVIAMIFIPIAQGAAGKACTK